MLFILLGTLNANVMAGPATPGAGMVLALVAACLPLVGLAVAGLAVTKGNVLGSVATGMEERRVTMDDIDKERGTGALLGRGLRHDGSLFAWG